MKRDSETIAVNVPTAMSEEIKRRAREEDRTLSNYLRRLLAQALAAPQPYDGGQVRP